VLALRDHLCQYPLPGMLDVVTTYASLAVYFDPKQLVSEIAPQKKALISPTAEMVLLLEKTLADLMPQKARGPEKTFEIPVVYDGPDLQWVAQQTGMTVEEVAKAHSEPLYTVFMVGFLPGFPYMGELPKTLQLPRRAEPRTKVPAGAVAIAGAQTGIYPCESPGGWHLIGTTPTRLFDVAKKEPALLSAGMKVRFVRSG
jgi:TIGR00370 family protein